MGDLDERHPIAAVTMTDGVINIRTVGLLPEWVGLSCRREAAERSNGALESCYPS